MIHPTQLGLIELKKDSRGRVRFCCDGFRFEVTKTGKVNVYKRTTRSEYPSMISAFVRPKAQTLRVLAEAIELAKS